MDQTLLQSVVRIPLKIESYGERCMNLTSFSPHSNFQMLTFPSTVPVAIKSPVLPFETILTFGDETAQAVAFVTCKIINNKNCLDYNIYAI